MMRILHFSDVHFPMTYAGAMWRERLHPKRFVATLNYAVRRRGRFRDAPAKWEAFRDVIEAGRFDGIICTGDVTSSGMSGELAAARARMEFLLDHPGWVMMPGNHDVYLPGVHARQYDRFFPAPSKGELIRPEGGAAEMPYARLLGGGLAVVAMNSVKPNPCLWCSSGRVDDRQMAAVRSLLAHDALRGRAVIVATHYNLDDRDSARHGLEGRAAVRCMLGEFPAIKAVLHGHVHRARCETVSEFSAPVYCAGSLTYRGREAFWVFEWDGESLRAKLGRWDGRQYRIADAGC